MFKPGDTLRNKNNPKKTFTFVYYESSGGLIKVMDDGTGLTASADPADFSLFKPQQIDFDFDDLFTDTILESEDENKKSPCDYSIHTRSETPMRLAEKGFKPYIYCTVCGFAIEEFKPFKKDTQ